MDNTPGLAALAAACETYRNGMLKCDGAALSAIVLDEVAFGHTSGLVQTKQEFLDSVTDGKTTWSSLAFENLRHRIVGNNAVSQFVFVGENRSGGQVNKLRFDTVVVWVAQGGAWKMLVRQGYNKVS